MMQHQPFFIEGTSASEASESGAIMAAARMLDTSAADPFNVTYTKDGNTITAVEVNGMVQEVRRSGGLVTSVGGKEVTSTFTRGGVAATPVFQTEGAYTGVLVRDAATSGSGAETLAIPAEDVLNLSEGAIVVPFYLEGNNLANPGVGFHALFRHNSSGVLDGLLLGITTTGVYGETTNALGASGATQITVTKAAITGWAEGWKAIGLRWKASELSIWFEGVKIGTAATPKLPTALASSFQLGNDATATGRQINAPLLALLVQYEAPSDTEMAEYTTLATFPTAPTAKTSLFLPLDSDLLNVARVVDLSYTAGELTGMETTTETLG